MAELDDQLRLQNPWWLDSGSLAKDPHLAAYAASSIRWNPPVLDALPVEFGHVHTLRGPRQVGKTTTVKRLIERLVAAGSRRVLYFACDLLDSYSDIVRLLLRAKEIHPAPDGDWHVFLDEVSAVRDWQRAVKWLWDQGAVRRDFVLLTGSSARDVRAGSERLPGRRGRGADYLQLPLSFRDFCSVAHALELPEPMSLDDLLRGGKLAVNSLFGRLGDLDRALEAYKNVGGYPAAVSDYVASGREGVRPETVRMLWEIVAADIAAARYDKAAALKLIEEVTISLGSPFTWAHGSKAMGFSDSESARNYTERLAENFVLLPMYFWEMSGSFQPRKQRKVYFVDPLFASVPGAIVPGARTVRTDALLENVVASGLYRSAGTSLVQAQPEPGAIGYWRSSGDRELDFVVPSVMWGRLAIEVKGDARGRLGYTRKAISQSFGRGVIVSQRMYEWHDSVPIVPGAVFLAALKERPLREVAIESDSLTAGLRLIGGSLETALDGT